MPHISIKMLNGRTPAQKKAVTEKIIKIIREELGTPERYISISVEDFSAKEWQDVFKNEVENNPALTKKPEYDPKDLL